MTAEPKLLSDAELGHCLERIDRHGIGTERIRSHIAALTTQRDGAQEDAAYLQRELGQYKSQYTEAHKRLDLADIPPAAGEACDDPACNSHLVHRVHVALAQLDAARQEAERAKGQLTKKRRLLLSAESAMTKVLNAAGGVAASYDGIAEQVIAKLNEAKQQLTAIKAPGEGDEELARFAHEQLEASRFPNDSQYRISWDRLPEPHRKWTLAMVSAVASRVRAASAAELADLRKEITEAHAELDKASIPRGMRSCDSLSVANRTAIARWRLDEWTKPMAPEAREEQRRSFAYGNAAIDDPSVTRAAIDNAAENLENQNKAAEKSTILHVKTVDGKPLDEEGVRKLQEYIDGQRNSVPTPIGAAIHSIRIFCGFGMRQFAEICRMLPSEFCDFENGRIGWSNLSFECQQRMLVELGKAAKSAREHFDSACAELSQHRQQVAQLTAELTQLRDELAVVRRELELERAKVARLYRRLDRFNEREQADLLHVIGAYRSIACSSDVPSVEQMCKQMAAHHGRQTAELVQLRQRAEWADELQRKLDRAHARIGELDFLMGAGKCDNCDQWKSRARRWRTISADIAKQRNKAQAELAAAKEQLSEAQRNVESLNAILREQGHGQGEIDSWADSAEENERLKAQLATLKTSADALSTDLATSEARCGSRERELERVRRACEPFVKWLRAFLRDCNWPSQTVRERLRTGEAVYTYGDLRNILAAFDARQPATPPIPEPEAPKSEQERPAPVGEGEQRQSERAVKELLQEQPKAFDKRRKAHAELVPIDEYERRVGEQPQPAFVCPKCGSGLITDIETFPVTHKCDECAHEWKDAAEAAAAQGGEVKS